MAFEDLNPVEKILVVLTCIAFVYGVYYSLNELFNNGGRPKGK